MAVATPTTLLVGGGFFEGPRWRDGRWWVSDFYRHAVVTVTPEGVEERVLEVAGQPSGLGWMPDGSMLVVSMRDHRVLRRTPSGEVTVHADLTSHCGGLLNDIVVDAEGRAWVGDFGFDLMGAADPRTTSLIRVDADGAATVAAEGLAFPNGSVITPDGGTLIVGETLACRYTAFSIAADGSLGDRRVWAQIAPSPELGSFAEMLPRVTVAPDGCCLDAEGHIWSADAVGGRCIRVAPGGAVVDEVRAPAGLGIFACMLGGDDGRTLLLCSAPDYFEHRRRDAREAVLLTTTVEVPHAGLP
ncbi:MAG TPA: SMP-30/gluconolactonase/LRE family protein [Candidatus Dormibacteraeota bacterium]